MVTVHSSLPPLRNIRRNAVTLTVNISTFHAAINWLNIIAGTSRNVLEVRLTLHLERYERHVF
ncbi:MAG: hypothetical protein ACTS47_02675 [Candidatus Hodgkinia cicadicola]